MKPIVIIPKGEFELTGNELKDLIERAYEQGFNDGQNVNRNVIIQPPYIPYRPYFTWTCNTTAGHELCAGNTGASSTI